MASSPPSWRIKTRPCPFYQQGRCLFADSCNFQHSVSARISSVPTSRPQTPSADSSRNVTSPDSARSPPRSPRLAGLLLALKDVIGEEPDDEHNPSDNSVNPVFMKENGCPNSVGSGSAPFAPVQDKDDENSSRPPLNEPAPEGQPSIYTVQSSPDNALPFDLLSPVDLSHLNLGSFNQGFSSAAERPSALGSGCADTWKSPPHLPQSPPRSPLKSTFGTLTSPFATPSLRVLSPQLGVFIDRPPQTPGSWDTESEPSLDTPQKDISLDGEGLAEGSEEYIVLGDNSPSPPAENVSEDQGSLALPRDGETQRITTPVLRNHVAFANTTIDDYHGEEREEGLFASPQKSEVHSVTVENAVFSAPFIPVGSQEECAEMTSPPWPSSTLDNGGFEAANSGSSPSALDVVDEMTNRYASTWDTDETSTNVYVGMPPPTPEEVQLAIDRVAETPSHFLNHTVEFDDYEPVGNSSLADPSSDGSLDAKSPVHSEFASSGTRRDDDVEYATQYDDSSFMDYYDNAESPEDAIVDHSQEDDIANGSKQVEIRSSADSSYDYSFEAETSASPELVTDVVDEDETDYTARFGNVSLNQFYDESFEEASLYLGIVDDPVPEQGSCTGYSTGFGNSSSVGSDNNWMEGNSVMTSPTAQAEDDTMDSTARFGNPSSVDSTYNSSQHRWSVYSGDHQTAISNETDNGDYTGELVYLGSPEGLINENDTLGSIYADYSGDSTESSDSLRTVSDAGPREDVKGKQPLSLPAALTSGLIRERVFTPPPGRTRSGTIIPSTDSPTSIPSPPVSFEPISARSSARSAWSPDSSVSSMQEVTVSKKVPFGFRQSLALGRIGRSSLGSNQTSKSSKAYPHPLALSSQSDRAFSPDALSPTESVTRGLRPLRLSALLGSKPSSAPSRTANFLINGYGNSSRASMSLATVSSRKSLSYNPLLSSKLTSTIPEHNEHTLLSEDNSSPLSSVHLSHLANFDEPHSAPLSRPAIWQSYEDDITQTTYSRQSRRLSRFSEPSFVYEEEEDDQDNTNHEYTIRLPLPVPQTAPASRNSMVRPPMYAIATPKPTLMFAIASDDVKQVRQVLESGDAGPNDSVGPQSALAFTLMNDQLVHKMEIVKTLLAFGADPKTVTAAKERDVAASRDDTGQSSPPSNPLLATLDSATKYYVERADAPQTRRTSALIHRSFFRPLMRVRYELVGQDHALEELFKVLSIHSRQLSVTPIVVLLCGPSGHGKSLLARKFGVLLDVPTHTVNMTTLNSTQDLWRSYSMSPYETPTACTLAEFLINNEGKRCVVVLDEIEKTHDEKTLWSLLMPWELGRCTFEASGRPVDVRNVVWLGTSNVGHDLVFEHHEARASPDELMSHGEYADLMGLLRPRVSKRLGASILSRVTSVLPFVPFTWDERRAICYEALHTIGGDLVSGLSMEAVERIVDAALMGYVAAEGARSLYRAASTQLVEQI